MYCAVFGCKNNNNKKRGYFHFFTFPKDEILRQKWLKFSQRTDVMNLKTARICCAHFKKEDFQNLMQFEMGFCKFLLLKTGACPSVPPKKVSSTCVKKRRNKTCAAKQYQVFSSNLCQESVEIVEYVDDVDQEINAEDTTSYEELTVSEDELIDIEPADEITALKQEIGRLKNENKQLRTESIAQSGQIKNIFLPEINRLKRQLMKADFKSQYMEENLREIFAQEKTDSKDFESVWLHTPDATGM